MLGKFIHRLEARKKRQNNSEMTPVDRFWESDLPTIMLEHEIGHPTPHEPVAVLASAREAPSVRAALDGLFLVPA
jgi:hypothetical protein